jgi:hypothetical protein
MRFEVGEQHLDLFALTARGSVSLGLGDVAGHIAGAFRKTGHCGSIAAAEWRACVVASDYELHLNCRGQSD